MALWPFGKKNDTPAEQEVHPDNVNAPEALSSLGAADNVPANGDTTLDPSAGEPDPVHDAVNGQTGPFDASEVSMQDFDFSDFAKGVLDLGSLQIPLPMDSEVQVEMGEQGPRMLHIVTQYGRLTPVAFAAPRSAGQWREATKEIAEGMRKDGLKVRVEKGPWGREVVGEANDRQIRIAGVDGPRWMLRVTMISPADRAEAMKELGREVIARTFVNRGDAPILAGSPLPVALPKQLAEQVQQAMAKRAEQGKTAQPQTPSESPINPGQQPDQGNPTHSG